MKTHILSLSIIITWLLGATSLSAQTTEVAVFSINDFHGAFVRNDYKNIAGAPSIWEVLDSLKQTYPLHVTVSAGDNFGGSYFYNATGGSLLPVFFDDLGIRLSAVGNHEFDDGQSSLAAKWADTPSKPEGWDITYVCANVRDNQTGAVPAFAQPVAVHNVSLSPTKQVTIAFAGLLASSTPQQASVSKLAGLSFDGRYTDVLDSLRHTPEGKILDEADIRILLTHVGTRTNKATGLPEWEDKDSANLVSLNDCRWDGILSSHSHNHVCGRINEANFPVVQGKWHGDYISALICTIDTTAKPKLLSVEPKTFRVSPRETFSEGPARLQAQIDSLLSHTFTQGGVPLGKVLTFATKDMEHDRANKYRQSEVGALVCQAYAEDFRKSKGLEANIPIVGCSHFGSIRAGFVKGTISVLDVGEALPFANRLKAYKLNGKQLRELVEFGLHNQKYGWIQTGWLDIELDAQGHVTQLFYTGPAGSKVELTTESSCFLVADEYMTTGGDGYSPDFFPEDQVVEAEGMATTTDAFINYLELFKEI